jgi:CheY-like chemotaxis protein
VKPRILVIVNCPRLLEGLVHALERNHFSTLAAVGAHEAWFLARQTLPELVLIRFAFPEPERSALIGRFRGDPRTATLKLIALFDAPDQNRSEAARLGFDDSVRLSIQHPAFISSLVRLIARSDRKWQAISQHNRELCEQTH